MEEGGTTYPLAGERCLAVKLVLSRVRRKLGPVGDRRTRRSWSWVGGRDWGWVDVGLSYVCCTLVTVKSERVLDKEGLAKSRFELENLEFPEGLSTGKSIRDERTSRSQCRDL
jgi:hypothetical protein